MLPFCFKKLNKYKLVIGVIPFRVIIDFPIHIKGKYIITCDHIILMHVMIHLPPLSPPCHGGGLVSLNDLTGYAYRNFVFLVRPPKPDRP